MARIRTIKPDFWTDETVGEASPTSRLLFIASWNIADDYGNLERSSRQLKAQVFAYDNVDAEKLVNELMVLGLLIEYERDGKKFLHIKGFDKHQKIEKKSAPRYPLYDESVRTPQPVGSGREGKGKGKGKGSPPLSPIDVPGLDHTQWTRWVEYRQSIGKALKPASLSAAAKAMAKFGADQAAVVETSIGNGWTGLFPLKPSGKPAKDPRFAPNRDFSQVNYREGVDEDGNF